MKAILHIIAIVAACGAAVFTFIHSNKIKDIETERVETIATNKQVTANADAADTDIKKEKSLLAASNDKKELLEQSVSSLKATGSSLSNDLAKLDDDLKGQDGEFAELEKALAEVNNILADLGGGVTLDTLPEKIQEIEDDKVAKQTKLEELEVLIEGSEKSLVSVRSEEKRLSKRISDRGSRISRETLSEVAQI